MLSTDSQRVKDYTVDVVNNSNGIKAVALAVRVLRESPILLTSGGPDSFIVWHLLGKPTMLYVDLGHRYSNQEREALKQLAAKYEDFVVLYRPYLGVGMAEQRDAFIPARNLLLATVASWESNKIYLALQKGELDLYDRSSEFCCQVSGILSKCHGQEVTVTSPIWDMTKAGLVKKYLEMGLPSEDLLQTWSCYTGSSGQLLMKACASCQACFRRWIAFSYNGLSESWYERMAQWSGVQEYLQKMKEGKYDVERTEETMSVFRKYGVVG